MSKQDNGMELLNKSFKLQDDVFALKNLLQSMGLFDPANELMRIYYDSKFVEFQKGKIEGKNELRNEIVLEALK